jgi:F420-dependent oxidoreductase-like protein
MLEVAIMIEGQNGLNWPRWQAIAREVERLGFVGLFRSDHYTNANPPDLDSLEMWVSLTWLASHTERLEFGPLVSPLSFRDPTFTARMASAVDDLSAGRLILGLGAGWQHREHKNYGWDLLDVNGRMNRFEEGLEVVNRLLNSDSPIGFSGEYFQLQEAVLLPRPRRAGGPPILIGGNGPRRTLPLTAKYASEWNGVFLTPEQFFGLSSRLDELLIKNGRQPQDVRRSLMLGTVFGQDQQELDKKMAKRTRSVQELRERGLMVGTGQQFAEQLKQYEEAGVQRVMLQWLDLDDLAGLEQLAAAVL